MKRTIPLLAAILIANGMTGVTTALASEKPWRVIDHANQESVQNPDRFGYQNAIMRYDYEEG